MSRGREPGQSRGANDSSYWSETQQVFHFLHASQLFPCFCWRNPPPDLLQNLLDGSFTRSFITTEAAGWIFSVTNKTSRPIRILARKWALSSSQIIQTQGQPGACTSMNQNQANKLEQALKARLTFFFTLYHNRKHEAKLPRKQNLSCRY